ncbi:uncharacterized protein LOC119795332 [Cyprinodon tularosa]|uniref:uncharacterized protein LOC119795332 n=1 Tax=Cyprinodon tularosa TaxID=77115 RepID=UPI0018E2726C|nr:uncharacterized protein LOC119795332 [Cyprinodon tularosa]
MGKLKETSQNIRGSHLLCSSPEPGTPGVENHKLADAVFGLQFTFLSFNTIIPLHLIRKLEQLGFNTPLCNWPLDFLTNRSQSIQVGHNTSDVITLSTGSPQGCVLIPLLFTLMTQVVGLISNDNDQDYREEVVVSAPAHQLLHLLSVAQVIFVSDEATTSVQEQHPNLGCSSPPGVPGSVVVAEEMASSQERFSWQANSNAGGGG